MLGVHLFLLKFIIGSIMYIPWSPFFFLLLYQTGPTVSELRQAQVRIISNDVCNAPYSYNGGILPGMLCAGLLQGGVDACQVSSRQSHPCHHPRSVWALPSMW